MQEKVDLQGALHPRNPHDLQPVVDPDAYSAPSLDFEPEDLEPRPFSASERRRALIVGGLLLTVVLLAVLPPLINMNRFRRQISTSIGASLGRPVHMDSVTLDLLPMPGFTLQNFSVGEDPAFGAEPTIRANQVRARLRFSSLWRRRVEFSRITFEDPSVNLVHISDGRWNVESTLVQAARVQAAPTAQKGAGDAPRFPYIEATGARLNVKMGPEKKPFSLTDARFSLWLANPEQWQLRLEAHPARTDTAATDTGIMRLEGTLGRASHLTEVPVEMQGEWTTAPLGAVTWILLGRDAGLRGEMTLRTSLHGTLGSNQVESRLELRRLRRADFVPTHTLEANLTCTGNALGIFHQVTGIHCAWPASLPSGPQPGTQPRLPIALGKRTVIQPESPAAAPQPATGLTATGQLPETLRPLTVTGLVILKDAPASGLLDLLRILSPRVSPDLTLTGLLSTTTAWPIASSPSGFSIPNAHLLLGAPAGEASSSATSVSDGPHAEDPIMDGPIAGAFSAGQLFFEPIALNLGAPTPALLEGHADEHGFAMHLTGSALRSRLLALAAALPQFGDGLEAALPPAPSPVSSPGAKPQAAPKSPESAIRLDLASTRTWSGQQVWEPVAIARPIHPHKSTHAR